MLCNAPCSAPSTAFVLIPALCVLPPCRQVVQPVFNLMAEQVGLMGEIGEAPALRLGYDDINESACLPQVGGRVMQAHSWCEAKQVQMRVFESSPMELSLWPAVPPGRQDTWSAAGRL
jgi:hypothetical protein